LIAAANKLIRNMVRMSEREDVVDVMELGFITEFRHMRSAGGQARSGQCRQFPLKPPNCDASVA
jgi:hypothetical protein